MSRLRLLEPSFVSDLVQPLRRWNQGKAGRSSLPEVPGHLCNPSEAVPGITGPGRERSKVYCQPWQNVAKHLEASGLAFQPDSSCPEEERESR